MFTADALPESVWLSFREQKPEAVTQPPAGLALDGAQKKCYAAPPPTERRLIVPQSFTVCIWKQAFLLCAVRGGDFM